MTDAENANKQSVVYVERGASADLSSTSFWVDDGLSIVQSYTHQV